MSGADAERWRRKWKLASAGTAQRASAAAMASMDGQNAFGQRGLGRGAPALFAAPLFTASHLQWRQPHFVVDCDGINAVLVKPLPQSVGKRHLLFAFLAEQR